MKKHLCLYLALFLIGNACHDPNIENHGEGHYSGIFSHGNFTDRISFEIVKDSVGWKIFFTSLEQNAFQIPTRNVAVEGDSIFFTLQSDRYTYTFKNKWDKDRGSLSGVLLVDTLRVAYALKKEKERELSLLQSEEVRFESNGLQLGERFGNLQHPCKKG